MLVGTLHRHIVTESKRLLQDPAVCMVMATGINPFGDGKAAARIVSTFLERTYS